MYYGEYLPFATIFNYEILAVQIFIDYTYYCRLAGSSRVMLSICRITMAGNIAVK